MHTSDLLHLAPSSISPTAHRRSTHTSSGLSPTPNSAGAVHQWRAL